MTGQPSAADPGPQGSGARRAWLLPAGTFVAGCLLGGTLVGLGTVGSDDDGPAGATASAAASPEAGDEPAQQEPDDGGLYVRVPDSCVQTADDATTLVEHVDRVVAAVADLEPEQLRQTVDEVQEVRDRVDRVAEQCRQDAAQRMQDAASAEATPTP